MPTNDRRKSNSAQERGTSSKTVRRRKARTTKERKHRRYNPAYAVTGPTGSMGAIDRLILKDLEELL